MKDYISDNGKIINVTSSVGKFGKFKPELAAKFFDPKLTRDGINGLAK